MVAARDNTIWVYSFVAHLARPGQFSHSVERLLDHTLGTRTDVDLTELEFGLFRASLGQYGIELREVTRRQKVKEEPVY